MSDKTLRRVAMDYGEHVSVRRHACWDTFALCARSQGARLVLVETDGGHLMQDFTFSSDDWLVLGRETEGFPEALRPHMHESVRIGMAPGARSLNVAVAGALALWEAMRQTGGLPDCGPANHPAERIR